VESPVYLTSTMQLGRVYDAACRIALAEEPRVAEEVVIPVVGECDDSWLSSAGVMHVEFEDVLAAREAARRSAGSGVRPATGAVGAGTGMLCLGWKGGIGTSSRVVEGGHVVAVLLLTNFGQADRLTVGGVPVGRILGRSGYAELPGTEFHHAHAGPAPGDVPAAGGTALQAAAARTAGPPPAGSCVGVVVTDAPLDAHGCRRLATRISLGLGRTGSTAHHASGEIFLAVSVGMRAARGARPATAGIGGAELDPLFEACVDATEEAVLDALLNAHDVVGRSGNRALALPHDALRGALSRGAGR
jgi:D-aminopeptidase